MKESNALIAAVTTTRAWDRLRDGLPQYTYYTKSKGRMILKLSKHASI